MTLRSRIASSRLARSAAFPIRFAAGGRHVARQTGLTAKWLVGSREHHNYTYHLTSRNIRHLSWWASVVSGASASTCLIWIKEILEDSELRKTYAAALASSHRSGLADAELRIGRRAGWYAVVRALQPETVVETGTDKGLGSLVLASALLRNGHGRLITMDVNPAAGYLISDRYAAVTSPVIGDSIAGIKALDVSVDVFVHDSDHRPEHERSEFEAVEPLLAAGARVLSDNAHASDSLLRWAEASGRRFLYFQEEPSNHWYRGAGIGAAWTA